MHSLNPPEGAVAHEESRIQELQGAAGLKQIGARYGKWAMLGVQDQDFLLMQKGRPLISAGVLKQGAALAADSCRIRRE